MDIRKIPIEKLNPAKYNPRKDLKPGDPEYEKLKKSMETFGKENEHLIKNDNQKDDKFYEFLLAAFQNIYQLFRWRCFMSFMPTLKD